MKLFFNWGVIMFMACGFLGGCSSNYQLSDFKEMTDSITAKTSAKLNKEKGLKLLCVGSRAMDDIQAMSMEFILYKVVDLKTARELLVYSIEEYLSDINSNKKIRPHLHDRPFTAQNIEIRILFYNPDRSNVSIGQLCLAIADEGNVEYYIKDSKNDFTTIQRETYEEALKAVSNK